MRITLEQAWQEIDRHAPALPACTRSLADALGHILQQDMVSPITQPPFPRSPLDGYALKAADSTGASPDSPRTLRVVDRSFAGVPAVRSVAGGEAVRIMTGAPIPEGADCVIRQEDTDQGEDFVQLFQALKPYANYCFAGEDYRTGDLLVSAGQRITAGVCAVLSGAGIDQVCVRPLPRVAVISTGSELQAAGSPLSYGKIYDSNCAYLTARLQELSIPHVTPHHVSDEPGALEDTFRSALEEHDLIISTGGVSVGQADLVPATLETLGGTCIFHGVHIKPGMPAAFYLVDGKPVLALSGNPFAAVVSFELLGRRLLAAMSGSAALLPQCEQAVLSVSYDKARPVRRFLSGMLQNGSVTLSEAQQNSKTHMLVDSNCIAELPAGDAPLPAGTTVTAYRF